MGIDRSTGSQDLGTGFGYGKEYGVLLCCGVGYCSVSFQSFDYRSFRCKVLSIQVVSIQTQAVNAWVNIFVL